MSWTSEIELGGNIGGYFDSGYIEEDYFEAFISPPSWVLESPI